MPRELTRLSVSPSSFTGRVDLNKLLELLQQVDPQGASALERAASFERDDWIMVYRWEVENSIGDSQHAVLIRGDEVERAQRHAGHDHQPGDGRPGFVSRNDGKGEFVTRWELVGEGDFVPLVHIRDFDGRFPSTVEISEDFRLCFDLHEDTVAREYATLNELGDRVVAAKWIGTDLFIAKRFVRRYQAARQLHLVLQFCVDRDGGSELKDLVDLDIDIQFDTWRVTYHGLKRTIGAERYFTRLLGKRILPPPPIEQAGMSPYTEPESYEDFIIAVDSEGRPVAHTCDPNQLANDFGKNPGAPNYLTPAYFRPDVLSKYYSNPDRYSVEDGYLRANHAFGLRMDNGRADQVAVFLGDLGNDLPYGEQQYWRSFNIEPTDGISEVAFRRSFLNQWASSDRVEHRFHAAFERMNAAWFDRFDWRLHSELHVHDAHLLSSLHVPTNPSLSQFSDQILRLATLTVDYLDKAAIVAATINATDAEGSISKLENYLIEQALPTKICSVLRRIQGARTKVAAHRKGSDFDIDILLDGNGSPPVLFTALLDDLTNAFEDLTTGLET